MGENSNSEQNTSATPQDDMDVDHAFGYVVGMKLEGAKPSASVPKVSPREDPDWRAEKEDRRFNQQGRIGQPPRYTFECGYGTTPVEDPWPPFVQRLPEERVLVDFNTPGVPWSVHLPGLNVNDSKAFPFPWGVDVYARAISTPEMRNRIRNIISAHHVIPFFVFRPPVWLLLNAVKAGGKRFATHPQPCIAISTQVIYCYLQVLHVLEGSTHARTAEQIGMINKAHLNDIESLIKRFESAMANNADFKALAERSLTCINEPAGDDLPLLMDFARYLVTFTCNYIKLLERKIINLADKALKADNFGTSMHCQFALPDPQNPRLTPVFDALTPTMQRELLETLKLKYSLVADGADASFPQEPVFAPENSFHGISVPMLRLMLCYYYPKHE